jgi:hypothetical protein
MKARYAPLILLFACLGAMAECEINATPDQIQSTKEQMRADPKLHSIEVAGRAERISIQNEDGSFVIGHFTQQKHEAHPAFVISSVYEHEEKIWVYHQGFTAGDCEIFQSWIKSFEERDQELQEMYRAEGS